MPDLISDRNSRLLLRKMRRLDNDLPRLLVSPLPEAMKSLAVEINVDRPSLEEENKLRKMADLAIALNRRPQLGFCLRRSLVRSYFLRQAGVPVVVHFGARIIEGKPDREITGHAWLTLENNPYYESPENWRDFTIMVSFPQQS